MCYDTCKIHSTTNHESTQRSCALARDGTGKRNMNTTVVNMHSFECSGMKQLLRGLFPEQAKRAARHAEPQRLPCLCMEAFPWSFLTSRCHGDCSDRWYDSSRIQNHPPSSAAFDKLSVKKWRLPMPEMGCRKQPALKQTAAIPTRSSNVVRFPLPEILSTFGFVHSTAWFAIQRVTKLYSIRMASRRDPSQQQSTSCPWLSSKTQSQSKPKHLIYLGNTQRGNSAVS